MNPYFTERLAKEHRDDLLRAAETSRLAHSAEIKARNRTPLHRAADHNGPVHTATSSLTVPRTRPRRGHASLFYALAPRAAWLKTHNTQHGRLEPRDNQVGSRRK